MRKDSKSSHKANQKAVSSAIHPEAVAAAYRAIPDDETLYSIVEMLKALSDPTRARILYALAQQPLCVQDLVEIVGVSQPAVSHQLRFLRDRRLIRARREGNIVYHTIENAHVAAVFKEAEYYADHVRRGLPDHSYP